MSLRKPLRDTDDKTSNGEVWTTITESIFEEEALVWLGNLGWQTAHGPDIAPATPGAERAYVYLLEAVRF